MLAADIEVLLMQYLIKKNIVDLIKKIIYHITYFKDFVVMNMYRQIPRLIHTLSSCLILFYIRSKANKRLLQKTTSKE